MNITKTKDPHFTPGRPNYTELYKPACIAWVGVFLFRLFRHSQPQQAVFGSAIAPAPGTGANLLATPAQSPEKIILLKGEKSL
jgi:hypothetical protein